jgi:hypothetical protein
MSPASTPGRDRFAATTRVAGFRVRVYQANRSLPVSASLGRIKRDLGNCWLVVIEYRYSLGRSIITTCEFSRNRSNTICFPSLVMSKVRMLARF